MTCAELKPVAWALTPVNWLLRLKEFFVRHALVIKTVDYVLIFYVHRKDHVSLSLEIARGRFEGKTT